MEQVSVAIVSLSTAGPKVLKLLAASALRVSDCNTPRLPLRPVRDVRLPGEDRRRIPDGGQGLERRPALRLRSQAEAQVALEGFDQLAPQGPGHQMREHRVESHSLGRQQGLRFPEISHPFAAIRATSASLGH